MEVTSDRSMKVLATGGDRRLGGMDFDNLILDKMFETARQGGLDIETEPWARQDAYGKAEAVKKELSTLDSAAASLTGSGRPLAFELTRAQFEKLIKDKITATEDTTVYTLETGGPETVRRRHRADGRRVEPDPRVPEDARAHLRQAAGVLPQPRRGRGPRRGHARG